VYTCMIIGCGGEGEIRTREKEKGGREKKRASCGRLFSPSLFLLPLPTSNRTLSHFSFFPS
jgi:hypothetical protein